MNFYQVKCMLLLQITYAVATR